MSFSAAPVKTDKETENKLLFFCLWVCENVPRTSVKSVQSTSSHPAESPE